MSTGYNFTDGIRRTLARSREHAQGLRNDAIQYFGEMPSSSPPA